MKKKFAKHEDHESIKEYGFAMKHVDIKEFKGNICLVDIYKVKRDWYVPRNDGKEERILANGFKWLLFYPDVSDHAITVLFDDKKEIVEWYIDVVKGMGMENNIPYRLDLYLDLVITADGEKYILDEDELKQALENHDITQEDFDLAYRILKKLLEKYDNEKNLNNLRKMSYKYLDELLKCNTEYCVNKNDINNIKKL